MKSSGKSLFKWPSHLLSAGIFFIALALLVWVAYGRFPSTEDASIDADVVRVASASGGRLIKLAVHENDLVHKGDLLLQIDPQPYQLTLEHAVADLEVARAALATQRRAVSTQKSAVTQANEQVQRARTNVELAQRSEERLAPLAAKGYVPQQQLDQAQTASRDAATSMRQAEEQSRAARKAVGSDESAVAAVRAATVAVAMAQRALDETVVRASHDGRVVGLTVSTGEMLAPGQSIFTLINTEEWFASANLRETDLQGVSIGQCATVYSMLDRKHPMRGVVQGIGWGVHAEDRVDLPRSVPYVPASLNWVRVAQRFPVRIHLPNPPEGLVRMGASASVEIGYGAACR